MVVPMQFSVMSSDIVCLGFKFTSSSSAPVPSVGYVFSVQFIEYNKERIQCINFINFITFLMHDAAGDVGLSLLH